MLLKLSILAIPAVIADLPSCNVITTSDRSTDLKTKFIKDPKKWNPYFRLTIVFNDFFAIFYILGANEALKYCLQLILIQKIKLNVLYFYFFKSFVFWRICVNSRFFHLCLSESGRDLTISRILNILEVGKK